MTVIPLGNASSEDDNSSICISSSSPFMCDLAARPLMLKPLEGSGLFIAGMPPSLLNEMKSASLSNAAGVVAEEEGVSVVGGVPLPNIRLANDIVHAFLAVPGALSVASL